MGILEKLRQETRQAHIDLEQISGADRIINHSIDLKQYTSLLQSNYIAYAKAEAQLAPLHNKSIAQWIHQDLHYLDAAIPNFSSNGDNQAISSHGKLGVQYVIEGSLLGGAMIAQHITQCPALFHLPPQHFYASGSPERAQRWRNFIATMNATNFSAQESTEIIDAANQTFDLFKLAFLESDKK